MARRSTSEIATAMIEHSNERRSAVRTSVETSCAGSVLQSTWASSPISGTAMKRTATAAGMTSPMSGRRVTPPITTSAAGRKPAVRNSV